MNNDKWGGALDGCDFSMAREDILRTMTMLRQDGEKEGKVVYISPEFASALKAFYSNPVVENAVVLLEVAPKLLPMFQFNSTQNPLFKYGINMYNSEDDDPPSEHQSTKY